MQSNVLMVCSALQLYQKQWKKEKEEEEDEEKEEVLGITYD